MKFGKKLLAVKYSSQPEWAPFWPNYKMLKMKIKDIQVVLDESTEKSDSAPAPDASSAAENFRDPSNIKRSTEEVAFFKALYGELRKGADFFTSMGTQYQARLHRIYEGLRQLQNRDEECKTHQDATSLLAACLSLYKELIMLENFAVMTHTAFSKILKKHDKRTMYRTREQFMRNKVNVASFARYPDIKHMLLQLEDMYREINALQANWFNVQGGDETGNGEAGDGEGPHPHGMVDERDAKGEERNEAATAASGAATARGGCAPSRRCSLGSPGATPSTLEIEEARTLTLESKTELQHELNGGPSSSAASSSSSSSSSAAPGGAAAAVSGGSSAALDLKSGGGGQRASPHEKEAAVALLLAAGQVRRHDGATEKSSEGTGAAEAPTPKPKSRWGAEHLASVKRQRT